MNGSRNEALVICYPEDLLRVVDDVRDLFELGSVDVENFIVL